MVSIRGRTWPGTFVGAAVAAPLVAASVASVPFVVPSFAHVILSLRKSEHVCLAYSTVATLGAASTAAAATATTG